MLVYMIHAGLYVLIASLAAGQCFSTPGRVDLEVNAAHVGAAWWLAEAQPGGRACLPGPGPAGAHLIHQQALLQQAAQQGLQHSPTRLFLPAGWSHDQEINIS